jgi:SAC3 family protein LENG8/THP3
MSQPTTPPAEKKKVDWPPPVREYVQRCFAPESAIQGIDAPMIEAKLKEVITEAAEGNRILDIDWANLPLPQQLIQQERAMTSWDTQGTADMSWEPSEPIVDNGPSKKRKLTTTNIVDNHSKKKTTTQQTSPPRWGKELEREPSGFGDRITYATKSQANKIEKRVRKQQEALGKGSSKFQAAAEKRKQRFGAQLDDSPPWASRQIDIIEAPTGPVIGSCQKLEKNYFRLTSPPKPEEVRPQEVLERTFALLKKKWSAETNYVYICDQFKSMRQDLLVQHIKNKFTVSVYELHARIALEKKDLGEYNQCQTQLRALYALGIEGDRVEFMAYRILYFVHTCNRIGLNDVLADITPEDRLQPPIQHALAVRSAQASGNYHKLLAKLYQGVPNMGAYLMDLFVDRERIAALAIICKS